MTEIELEQAVSIITEHTKLITQTTRLPLAKCLNWRLAEDAAATIAIPPFDRSPLDGYALVSTDTAQTAPEAPVRLAVVDEICAGDHYHGSGPVKPGQAVRIMTGAMMPPGCDCVIRQEDVRAEGDSVLVSTPMKHHQNVVFKGEDIRQGQLLVKKNEYLGYAHIGVLASVGFDEVEVFVKPRVGLMCTGDEIVEPGQPLGPGKIYNSNRYLLEMRVAEMDIPMQVIPAAGDDAEHVAKQIDQHINELDVLITTGGVSVGKKDIMHDVFRILGVERLFWRIKMKPGTPVLFGLYKGKPLLCLSGNPFAAATTLELLARPLLAKMCDRPDLAPYRTRAVMRTAFANESKGRRFIRGRLGADGVYLPKGHSSGQIYSMVDCNCLVDIPAGTPPLKPGDEVEVVVL